MTDKEFFRSLVQVQPVTCEFRMPKGWLEAPVTFSVNDISVNGVDLVFSGSTNGVRVTAKVDTFEVWAERNYYAKDFVVSIRGPSNEFYGYCLGPLNADTVIGALNDHIIRYHNYMEIANNINSHYWGKELHVRSLTDEMIHLYKAFNIPRVL